MQERIKEIVGGFLKMPAGQIDTATVIDRSVVSNSILLHRMYAKLAAENFMVSNYQDVRTFGDLLKGLNDSNVAADSNKANGTAVHINEAPVYLVSSNTSASIGAGIDIEDISAMPVVPDFREDDFYAMNFSAAEISYCILQPKPYASFAGLFAAKEAIVKADNRFKKTAFSNIVIQHLANGTPFFPGFNISISHTNEVAVAVAIPLQQNMQPAVENASVAAAKPAAGIPVLAWLLVLTSLLLSVIALVLISKKG